ncbi:MAG: hypothetical protein R3B99_22115 [Polyangiales bacterium]
MPTATERLLATPDPERVFRAFVEGALALGRQSRTARVDSDEIARAESSDETRVASEPPRRTPGSTTQRLEAIELVPDVAAIRPPEAPVRERSEDGQIPARSSKGASATWVSCFATATSRRSQSGSTSSLASCPQDLLLLRRIAEFHLEHG